jgi:uncharacterized protein YjbJ (UPF0337 family)
MFTSVFPSVLEMRAVAGPFRRSSPEHRRRRRRSIAAKLPLLFLKVMDMDENEVVGAVKKSAGRVQAAAGAISGNNGMEARGKLNEAAGSAQKLYGQAADQVRGAAGAAGELITEQPVASMAIAAVAGLALGLLIGTAL